jgi:hypothetical protein
MVLDSINQFPELKIIDVQQVYKRKFKGVPEQAFYKAISRMAQNGEIERLTKGIYCKPKKGRFGNIVSSEKHILEHYLGENMKTGVVIGYRMYNKYKLTTQVSKSVEVYSNMSEHEIKKIENVEIIKVNVRFDDTTKKMIELLHFLENMNQIEDLSMDNVKIFIENAIVYYNEKTLEKLIKSIGYKKSTLASLKNILDYFNISHTVEKYLNGTSKYKSITMEDIYESASQ